MNKSVAVGKMLCIFETIQIEIRAFYSLWHFQRREAKRKKWSGLFVSFDLKIYFHINLKA